MKLTRQGVRDLNPRNLNGHRARRCRHFYGPVKAVGHEWAYDEMGATYLRRETYGRACIHCGDVRCEP
jgi:hypothetical protein